jgi:transketolase
MQFTKPLTIEEKSINTIRTLAIDAVQKANSGHPGAPMGLAPTAYVLFHKIMNHNPANPGWFNRDRFVLSNGHASMLLYASLHLCGYDISLEDLKQFRQWGSITPGHPEAHLTPGVETTTGPLGQGIMNSVGMAIAEAHMAAVYNREGHEIVDHYTYAICGDGDLMEGASHEAASLAGHLGLHKLIWIYDDNHISIEGSTDLAYTDNVVKRFEGYNWHVQNIGEAGNDINAIEKAIKRAKREKNRPSLIIIRTHIGYGSPHKQDTSEVHGSPLGEEEVKLTKRNYGWPEDATFWVPDEVREHFAEVKKRGKGKESGWKRKFNRYKKAFPELAAQFDAALSGKLPENWDADLPTFSPADGAIATRKASGKVINAFADHVPWFVGGSADLSPSTNTLIKSSGYFQKGAYQNRNIAWGVREHVMAAACNGMALHGGIRPYGATFFVFTDYARPALRLAALMELPVIHVMTHDSIGLGEDGPTHQPIEHLPSLRAMPNMTLIRPADANETTYAWRTALGNTHGPTLLVLTRQGLPVIDRSKYAPADGVLKGAYVLAKEKGNLPQAIIIASGSEVAIALTAWETLQNEGVDVRLVSMPSWELFEAQSSEYRESVLPEAVTARVAIEAAAPLGWCKWVGDRGIVMGIERFGASAPYKEIYRHFGLTAEKVVENVKKLV